MKSSLTFSTFLEQERNKTYFQQLEKTLEIEYKNYQIYPQKQDLFRAIELTSLEKLKIVIVGQDPYHQKGQADGLAFSSRAKILPPSLKNIFSEIKKSYPNFSKTDGNLQNWAKQGVLLLNTVLSVRESSPNSHEKIGWQTFSLNLINFIVANKKDIVFLILGQKAKTCLKNVDFSVQKVFFYSHPSPLGFWRSLENSRVFEKINDFLKLKNKEQINWNL
ncbi:uracil-DNA glycosylase [Mesomycoplasma ovipneumoniae]|uniref:uracil-DNA glycosylase n=1 Tax=Mesomycoplasma ovipneumoniae TaxID=29562 RepID=UPI00083E6FE5|nr:uracil-DNA glycosylase [Mesomycoplasma ovipneumoniae]WDV48747.1 uracil-DNA glycosylase [Mesomycoplasma ovipneumoniae ATCC 29419]